MNWSRISRKFTSVGSGFVGAASLIALITLAARAFGFFRWFAQSVWVGAGPVANAYASANQLPNVIFEIAAGGALAGVAVPLLAAPMAKHLKEDVNRLASALFTWALVILVPLSLLVWVFATEIVSLLPVTAGSDELGQNALAAAFLRVFSIQMPLYGISVVLTGILQAQKKFVWPALAPLLSSIVVIATYAGYGLLSHGIDDPMRTPIEAINILAWGTTGGVAAMSLPLFFPVWKSGVRLRFTLRLDSATAKRAVALGSAGIGALLAQQIAVLVNLFLARWGGELGTIAVFQYTQAIYVLPYAVFAVPVATTVFPRLSELASRHFLEEFRALCARSTRSIVAVSLLGAGILIALAPAAQEIFGWTRRLDGMSEALILLAPALVGYSLLFHLSRVLYALDAGKYAVSGAALGWLGTAIAATIAVLIMSPHGGDGPATLMGMSIGQSIGMSMAGVSLLFFVSKRAGKGALKGLATTLLIMTPTSALVAIAGRYLYLYLYGWLDLGIGGAIISALASGIVITAFGFAVIAVGLRGRLPFSRKS